MKKILKFVFILAPWFLSAILFKTDKTFYKNINKPFFAPTPIVFPIVWTILYILLAISIYLIYKDNKFSETKNYNKTLIINYIANQAFQFLFFTIKSPFLALIDTIIVLVSSLYLYYESKKLNKTSAKLIIPYIIWNAFATILIMSIFFMNL